MPRKFNCDTCAIKYRDGNLRDYLLHRLEENDMITVDKIIEDNTPTLTEEEKSIAEEEAKQEMIKKITSEDMVDDDFDSEREMNINQGGGFVPIKLTPNNRRIPKPKPKPPPVPQISFDIFEELRKFKELLVNGIIDQSQFDMANQLLFDKYRKDVLG